MNRRRQTKLRRAPCQAIALAMLALPLTAASLDDDLQTRNGKALRVCADPNNLPFSDQAGEGFENRLAELIGRELNAKVEYTWWAQRRGFFRNTLAAGLCDVVMGVPSDLPMALTTLPYYRSSYVFVYRKDRHYALDSLDDARLARLKIGMHVMGGNNTPPAMALAERGIVSNVVGYSIYGDYRNASPPARLIDAVATGDVDLAIAWGPLAGYFAKREPVPLEVVPLAPSSATALPLEFSISLGVRKDAQAMKTKLDSVLTEKRGEIHALLEEYNVPLIEAAQ